MTPERLARLQLIKGETLALERAVPFDNIAHGNSIAREWQVRNEQTEEDRQARKKLLATPGHCGTCGVLVGLPFNLCYRCANHAKRKAQREEYAKRNAAGVPQKRPSWGRALHTLDRLGCSQNMCIVVAALWGIDDWEVVSDAVAKFRVTKGTRFPKEAKP